MVSPNLTEGLPFSVKPPQMTPSQIHPEVCLLGDFKSSQVGDGDEPSQHPFIIAHHCLLFPDCGNHQFTFCLCGFAYSSYAANSRTVCQKRVQFSFFPFQIDIPYPFVLTEKCRGLLLQGINHEMKVKTMPEHFQSMWRVFWLVSMSVCHSLESSVVRSLD